MDIRVDVKLHGPLLDGTAPRIFREFAEDVRQELGAQAFADVHQLLDQNVKNPTPYYETQIVTQEMRGATVVHDRGVIYGPWLEGVSSRNARTRFKGYAAFRRAAQRLERKAPALLDGMTRRLLGRLR